MKIRFENPPAKPPVKLLIDYTTVSGHQFRAGSLHNVTPNEVNHIGLTDPRTGHVVFFARSEWM